MFKKTVMTVAAIAALSVLFQGCSGEKQRSGKKDPHLKKGEELLQAKKYEAAEAELRQAVEKNLNHASAHYRLGLSLQGQGGDKLFEAFKEVDVACNLEPSPECLKTRSELGPLAASRLVEDLLKDNELKLSGVIREAGERLSSPYLVEAMLKTLLGSEGKDKAERLKTAFSDLDLLQDLTGAAENPLYAWKARMAALYLISDHPKVDEKLDAYFSILFRYGLEQCEDWEMTASGPTVTGAAVSAYRDKLMALAKQDLDQMFLVLSRVIQKVSAEVDQDTRFECMASSLSYFFDAPEFEMLKAELGKDSIEPSWTSFAPVFEFEKRPVQLIEAIVRIGILFDFGPEFIEKNAAAACDTALKFLADDDLSVNIAGVFMFSVLTEGPFDSESILTGLDQERLEKSLTELASFYERFIKTAKENPGSLPDQLGLSEDDMKSFMTSFVYAVPKVHKSLAEALAKKLEEASGDKKEIPELSAPAPDELPGLMDFKVFQLEARVNLSSIFSSQISHFGEQNVFAASFADLGWKPLEDNRYVYVMGDAFYPVAGDKMTKEQAIEALTKLGITTAVSEKGFTAAAVANFDSDADFDVWTVNDLRDIKQVTSD